MLEHRFEVFLNAVVQGKASREEALTWFMQLSPDSQREASIWLYQAGVQAGASDADVPLAIEKSGIRPTVSAATCLSAGLQRADKVLHMKGKDAMHAFRLLLALFALADERRRTKRCRDGCTHWWHNLGHEWTIVRDELRRQRH